MRTAGRRSPIRLLMPVLVAVACGASFMASSVATGRTPVSSAAAAQPAGPCAGFTTRVGAVSDEFTDPSVDTSAWAVYPDLPQSASKQSASDELRYEPDNTVVRNGKLVLRLDRSATGWAAGGVESRANVPGDDACVVVRAKGGMSTYDDNVLSAIWLQRRPLSTDPGNPNPETDIQEFVYAERMHSALHLWTYDAATGTFEHQGGEDEDPPWMREKAVGVDTTRAFHTYAMRRQDGVLTFLFDGVETYSLPVPEAYARQFNWGRHLILSLQGNPDGPPSDSLPLPAKFEVDYVRAFTP